MSALGDVVAALEAAVTRLEDAADAMAQVLTDTDTALDAARSADWPPAVEALDQLKDEGDELAARLAGGRSALEGFAARIQEIMDDL